MRRRYVVAAAAVAILLVTAGCLGGGNGQPTATPTPEPTTTDTPTTDAPEPTTTDTPTITTTTTSEPEPDISASISRLESQPVYDGEAKFRLTLTNSGPTGENAYNVTVARQEGGDFDRTATGNVTVGANAVVNRTVTVDFRATGTYDVYLNGQQQATVDVRGLRVGDGGGSDTTTSEPAPPGIDVSVSGSSVVG